MTDSQDMDTLASLTSSIGTVVALLVPAVIIAVLRIGDVTMNVFRTVFTVQGRKGLAALAHGVEAGIWLAAAGIVFADLTPVRMAGFVIGVMAGTLAGTTLIERLRLGTVTVRIYVDASEDDYAGLRIADAIHEAGFGATTFNGTGYRGPVQMVLSTVRRKDANEVADIARAIRVDSLVAIDNEMQQLATAGGRV